MLVWQLSLSDCVMGLTNRGRLPAVPNVWKLCQHQSSVGVECLLECVGGPQGLVRGSHVLEGLCLACLLA